MGLNLVMSMFSILVLFSSTSSADVGANPAPAPAPTPVACGDFDVTNAKYGGKADSEIAQALTTAWKDACASPTAAKIIVPKGTYKLKEATLQGPCKAPLELQVQGIILAPEDDTQLTKKDTWIEIMYINDFMLSGGGTFDGQGAKCWRDGGGDGKEYGGAVNIRFHQIKNSIVKDITSKNSKNFHINVINAEQLTFQNVKISAPEDSPNTDGIHVARSVGITITDSLIATGDDCISIGDGMKNLTVTKVTCGPGHGLSIGSLGKFEKEEPVEGITIKNCTMVKTDNGVRIKTFAKNPMAITVSDVCFEDIIMENVTNPIILDQEYCPSNKCEKGASSLIKISNVSYKNIRGTTPTAMAVKIVCSKDNPCEKVDLVDIDLKLIGQGELTSVCTNAKTTLTNVPKPLSCATDAPVTPQSTEGSTSGEL